MKLCCENSDLNFERKEIAYKKEEGKKEKNETKIFPLNGTL